MKSRSRTEIITETEREMSVRIQRRTSRRFFRASCDACGGSMLSINEAAQISDFDWREIVRLIKTDAVHSTETGAGEIYVCAASLLETK